MGFVLLDFSSADCFCFPVVLQVARQLNSKLTISDACSGTDKEGMEGIL